MQQNDNEKPQGEKENLEDRSSENSYATLDRKSIRIDYKYYGEPAKELIFNKPCAT